MKKRNKLDISQGFDINCMMSTSWEIKWSHLPGTLILMGTGRSTTMNGSQWWHQSNWHHRQYFLLLLKKSSEKSRLRAGSISLPGFRSWKILFFILDILCNAIIFIFYIFPFLMPNTFSIAKSISHFDRI